jgi:hypothetical protein
MFSIFRTSPVICRHLSVTSWVKNMVDYSLQEYWELIQIYRRGDESALLALQLMSYTNTKIERALQVQGLAA